jgi:DNA-binding response OmpR family regulator
MGRDVRQERSAPQNAIDCTASGVKPYSRSTTVDYSDGRYKVASLGRILVADDEPKIRSFVGRALKAAGYDADFADDSAMALRVARENCYDLVILDLGPVSLTKLEFLLLRELMDHAGESVSKSKLLASVWGYGCDPGSNVIDARIRRLRSKLGFDLIKTVRGEGYQLIAR